jgi:hypothetical protein
MRHETHISGIPCIAVVTGYHLQRPMGPSADSDWDAEGYEEIEFEICDRRGRLAPWLERKATDADMARISDEISELKQHERNFCYE